MKTAGTPGTVISRAAESSRFKFDARLVWVFIVSVK